MTEQSLFQFQHSRNKAGIKHWQIRTQNGQYTWGQSPAFPSIEAFTQVWCGAGVVGLLTVTCVLAESEVLAISAVCRTSVLV